MLKTYEKEEIGDFYSSEKFTKDFDQPPNSHVSRSQKSCAYGSQPTHKHVSRLVGFKDESHNFFDTNNVEFKTNK